MFIPKPNSKCFFDSGKKLSLAECFERNKIASFFCLFVNLATADSISVSVSPTKDSRFITVLNTVWKEVSQKLHALAKDFKYISQRKLIISMKAFTKGFNIF